MASAKQLRNLPSVDEMLRHRDILTAAELSPRAQLVQWIRSAVDKCREAILSGQELDADAATRFVVEVTLQQQASEKGCRVQTVINATGILLHTNLGRAPLAERAIQRVLQSSGYANVEMNLQSGRRSGRGERACSLLRQLTGAEDVAIVNNCAAATMLVLQTMAAGREVIVSRGQLVEIGGGYRLPEVFAASGAVLREVGTTNRTYLRDYENAIGVNTAAIIRVHRSNFYQGGFVTEPDISDLVALGKDRGIPVIDDIGSGCMTDLSVFGLSEPTVPESIRAGADLTLFSGDKLFGGPQAGIIVGMAEHIATLRSSPMMRALRVDKMTLAAIEATTEIHLSGNASGELPLLQMLSTPADEIQLRCRRIADQLILPHGMCCDVVECTSQVGGGSVPGSQIPSFGLCLSGSDNEKLAQNLRTSSPAVLGRINDDAVVLDLRTVSTAMLDPFAAAVQSAITQHSGAEA